MKILGLITTAAALLPLPVMAQAACFARTYSAEHLQANPGQQVSQIRALHVPSAGDMPESYDMRLLFRDDSREFSATPFCDDIDGETNCMIECDGGIIRPAMDEAGSLRLSTDYLRAETSAPTALESEGGCVEPVVRSIADLAPSGASIETVFILHPQEPGVCDWARR